MLKKYIPVCFILNVFAIKIYFTLFFFVVLLIIIIYYKVNGILNNSAQRVFFLNGHNRKEEKNYNIKK